MTQNIVMSTFVILCQFVKFIKLKERCFPEGKTPLFCHPWECCIIAIMWKNKKTLLFGLGILGGGVETAKFLLKKGVKLSVTDSKTKEHLAPSIAKLPKNISYTLGLHKDSDIKNVEAVIFNPGVAYESEWVKKALQYKKEVYNDFSLFLSVLKEKKEVPQYIAVTGTRGKTSSTTWIHHFIKDSAVGGNMPENGLLKIVNQKTNLFALELSSFQLEFVQKGSLAPKVAVITNLYRDHLNRYKKMEKYAKAKANIFLNQTKEDFLVLNADNEWSAFFLKQKPKAQVYWFSLKPLAKGKKGMYLKGDKLVWRETKDVVVGTSPFTDVAHNANLLTALTGSYLYTGSWQELFGKIDTLPQVPLRQEVIFEAKKLKVVNDGAATSPDATVALLDAYKGVPKEDKVLITGGTDKELEYSAWAKKVAKEIAPQNLFLLSGSATLKMIKALTKEGYWLNRVRKTRSPDQSKTDLGRKMNPRIFDNYEEMLSVIRISFCHSGEGRNPVSHPHPQDPNVIVSKKFLKDVSSSKKSQLHILFSPSAASFEKFKNEFDRASKFVKVLKGSGLIN
jgi:UDP-N-acetylmuramoylalanine--D-glutamate ligase